MQSTPSHSKAKGAKPCQAIVSQSEEQYCNLGLDEEIAVKLGTSLTLYTTGEGWQANLEPSRRFSLNTEFLSFQLVSDFTVSNPVLCEGRHVEKHDNEVPWGWLLLGSLPGHSLVFGHHRLSLLYMLVLYV